MKPKRISILGATGSIGASTLAVVAAHPERYRVSALAAGTNHAAMAELALRFHPEIVAMGDPTAAERLRETLQKILGTRAPEVLEGESGLATAAAFSTDLVVSAIVGGAGLLPTFAAVRAGHDVALANKESLVMAGNLLTDEASRRGVRILPVDSEHSAIFQCLAAGRREDLDHVLLTASGGPFRTLGARELEMVTPEQARNHPNWDMGAKITVDSATLMNKGLEVIEARWLFDLEPEQVRVLVHPQSIVHSMVVYRDGSVIAQLGTPDMRPPIACAMSWPERLPLDVPVPDFARLGALTFENPDTERFPCLALAFRAMREGGTLPAVLNAANEVAVDAFLNRHIPFTGIPRVVAATLDAHPAQSLDSLETLLEVDRAARQTALALTRKSAGKPAGKSVAEPTQRRA
ncbi:MAG: 1-deoxy-D-xylulose-5-phosphate reductoisomerase [Nitrospirota bacterium]|nr:1-deoxy-D-xylulose-5-phosphate reductoisomerase [Nitrospirota bacterium]